MIAVDRCERLRAALSFVDPSDVARMPPFEALAKNDSFYRRSQLWFDVLLRIETFFLNIRAFLDGARRSLQ